MTVREIDFLGQLQKPLIEACRKKGIGAFKRKTEEISVLGKQGNGARGVHSTEFEVGHYITRILAIIYVALVPGQVLNSSCLEISCRNLTMYAPSCREIYILPYRGSLCPNRCDIKSTLFCSLTIDHMWLLHNIGSESWILGRAIKLNQTQIVVLDQIFSCFDQISFGAALGIVWQSSVQNNFHNCDECYMKYVEVDLKNILKLLSINVYQII